MSWEPETYHIAKATRRPLVSWYDLCDGFMRVKSATLKAKGWHGIMGDSYFSGILCRYPEEDGRMIDDAIVVALVHW